MHSPEYFVTRMLQLFNLVTITVRGIAPHTLHTSPARTQPRSIIIYALITRGDGRAHLIGRYQRMTRLDGNPAWCGCPSEKYNTYAILTGHGMWVLHFTGECAEFHLIAGARVSKFGQFQNFALIIVSEFI